MQPPEFECFVAGRPRPQGSKSQGRNGRMYEASEYLKKWRTDVAAAALYRRMELRIAQFAGPLMLGVEFLFARPGTRRSPGVHWLRCEQCNGKGNYVVKKGEAFASGLDALAHCKPCRGSGLALRANAPVYMIGKPDKDKLVRSVGDALVVAGVVRDDSLFVKDHESGCKRYVNPGEQQGARIRIWKL